MSKTQNSSPVNIDRETRANRLRLELKNKFGINGVPDNGWLRYFPPMVLISEGIRYLIQNGGGKGFIDVIASRQIQMYIQEQRLHQHWTIERKDDNWVISMEDFYNGEPARVIQTVPLSEMDFLLDKFEVHVGYMDDMLCGVCLLNEED